MNEAREMNKVEKFRERADVNSTNLCALKPLRSLQCVAFFSRFQLKATAEEWAKAGNWEDTRRVGCRDGYCVHQCSVYDPRLVCFSTNPYEYASIKCNSHEDCKNVWLQWRTLLMRYHPKCFDKYTRCDMRGDIEG